MSAEAGSQRIVCIVEARYGSSRLPGKVLIPVLGKPMLARMLERVMRSKLADAVVVACPDTTENDAVEAAARTAGADVFRGSEDDVLDRVSGAAAAFGADIIVELTGDCPLHDPAIIDSVVADFLCGGADFAGNIHPYSTPRGTDVRVFRAVDLAEIAATSTDPADREHVSLHFWEHPDRYRCRNVEFPLPPAAANLRLTVDTESDLELVRAIFEALHPAKPQFSVEDVLAFVDSRPDLREVNAHIRQKAVR